MRLASRPEVSRVLTDELELHVEALDAIATYLARLPTTAMTSPSLSIANTVLDCTPMSADNRDRIVRVLKQNIRALEKVLNT
jgi:hypothetical protein